MLGCEAYDEEMGYNGLHRALKQLRAEIVMSDLLQYSDEREPWIIVHQTVYMFYIRKYN